ncbi:unnamed protein product, partial [Meganyctiphanes norvegica]
CKETRQTFFRPDTNQCFKFMWNQQRSWEAADAKCKSEGLTLAKPLNAITLRKYLLARYGGYNYWIAAKGAGTLFKWTVGSNKKMFASNPLWYTDYPGSKVSSDYCLALAGNPTDAKSHPNQPYTSKLCSESTRYALCELDMGHH